MELDEETTFLDELMSLRREAAAAASAQWQAAAAYTGGGGQGMMMGDLLFYGGTTEAAATATSGGGMDQLSPFHQQEPLQVQAPPHPHSHEEFNFDCLSEVCNPYRGGGVAVITGAEAAAVPGRALAALHDAMVEDETSGHLQGQQYGAGGSPTFVFGGAAGESSEQMPVVVRGAGGGPHHRSKVHGGGAPSKNLMAERRRRKRLNDRLSMLRSIVPKISKVCKATNQSCALVCSIPLIIR